MPAEIRDPELLAVTEEAATFSFDVASDGASVDAEARILVDGELRQRVAGVGTRLVRVAGLAPGARHRIRIEVDGAEPAAPDDWWPADFETLPAPTSDCVASFATTNDMHFGEPRFGGTLLENGDYGPVAEGFPEVTEREGDVPYWKYMNDDCIADINASGVDAAIVKGDIADRGLPEQFAAAARAFAKFAMPHHAFLGNHDYYGVNEGIEVDGYAALGQPPAPRALDLGGWRLLLLETVEPGEHHGVFDDARLRWLADAVAETRETGTPTLLLMHHQPVPPEHLDRYPNNIGMIPEHSLRLFDLLAEQPQVKGVLIGHTHRNRVRRYPRTGRLPFVEVHCTKDYPGGFAHYRLFEDGRFRQEVRRTSSDRALAHSTRCRDFFRGGYRRFSLGPLSARSFVAG
ncbi:MAG: metallophosphoesterase family protein [Myxococcota bacterium]